MCMLCVGYGGGSLLLFLVNYIFGSNFLLYLLLYMFFIISFYVNLCEWCFELFFSCFCWYSWDWFSSYFWVGSSNGFFCIFCYDSNSEMCVINFWYYWLSDVVSYLWEIFFLRVSG